MRNKTEIPLAGLEVRAAHSGRVVESTRTGLTCFLEETTTDAPSEPKRCAIPNPIPAVEAVTTATFPSSLRTTGAMIPPSLLPIVLKPSLQDSSSSSRHRFFE